MSNTTSFPARCALAAGFMSCIGSAAAFQQSLQQSSPAPGLAWLDGGRAQAGSPPAAFDAAAVERELQRAGMDRIGSLPVSCHGRRQHGVLYHVRKLPIGDATEVAAPALNNAGLVVGYRANPEDVIPTLWAGTTPYDLGAPEGEGGEAHGIGEHGAIVGMVGVPGPMRGFAAALWYKGARWILRSPDPANTEPFTVAVAINRHGTIVGNHHTLATDDDRPVVWRRGLPAVAVHDRIRARDQRRRLRGRQQRLFWRRVPPARRAVDAGRPRRRTGFPGRPRQPCIRHQQ